MIEKIIKNGFAYVKNGSVYMDVKKYSKTYNYGVLSGRKIEDNIEGTRELESQSEKRCCRFCTLEKSFKSSYNEMEFTMERRLSRMAY